MWIQLSLGIWSGKFSANLWAETCLNGSLVLLKEKAPSFPDYLFAILNSLLIYVHKGCPWIIHPNFTVHEKYLTSDNHRARWTNQHVPLHTRKQWPSLPIPEYWSQLHRYSEKDTFNKQIKYCQCLLWVYQIPADICVLDPVHHGISCCRSSVMVWWEQEWSISSRWTQKRDQHRLSMAHWLCPPDEWHAQSQWLSRAPQYTADLFEENIV